MLRHRLFKPSLPIAGISLFCCVLLSHSWLLPDDRESPPPDEICATVDDQPIYEREVRRELTRVLGEREVTVAAMDALRRKTLSQLVDRRLVLKYLTQEGLGASQQEVDRQMSRIKARLAREDLELDQYLGKAKLTLPDLQYATAWEIGWQRFLEEHLTDENLARYFAQHQRDFDGTELAVAHILFEIGPPKDQRAVDKALDKARDVRRRIQAGEMSFAEAARQHSAAAASAADGGQIGRIERRKPMPEAFSRAAFALDKGAISEPVATAFGVHLVRCQDVFPGQKQWEEVRAELEPEVTRYLFSWAADQQRAKSTVKILEKSR